MQSMVVVEKLKISGRAPRSARSRGRIARPRPPTNLALKARRMASTRGPRALRRRKNKSTSEATDPRQTASDQPSIMFLIDCAVNGLADALT